MPTAYVIGLGKSGNAAARLLQRQNWTVVVSDRSPTPNAAATALQAEGIRVNLGESFDPSIAQPDLIVVSPGVPWDLPSLVKARDLGIATMGEMELAWQSLAAIPWVAVTGTNGKTTVTALTAAIFQAAGHHAPAFGNIGYAACEVALLGQPPDWAIAELSSYQIESSPSVAPQIGIWTTFTPDHLARHKNLQTYFNLKAQLLAQAQEQIFNGDDPHLREIGQRGDFPVLDGACWTSVRGREYLIGDADRGAYIEDGWVIVQGTSIVRADALRMVGAHNQQNLLMAVAAAHMAGIPASAIAQAVATFPGVEHRLEPICTIGGVDYINDSKATNYDAAEVGLQAVAAPAILIAGGDPKEGDDTSWLQVIQAKAAAVLLIGTAAPAFAQRLEAVGYGSYEIVETMDKAVSRSAILAAETAAKVVLLSPACASFDQYSSFEQRGDHFRKLCQALMP
jgi:UDP-N-acetylmuramoylalanine--D-glutamate ligase